MFTTVECEAAIFGGHRRSGETPGPPAVLSRPGADHVLHRLPENRWAVLTRGDGPATAAALAALALPAEAVVITPHDPAAATLSPSDYRRAAGVLQAEPEVCLAFEDTPAGVATARAAGLAVVGVAIDGIAPEALGDADLVVPSLLSVRVLGTHPFVVLEVDAIPGVGTRTSPSA